VKKIDEVMAEIRARQDRATEPHPDFGQGSVEALNRAVLARSRRAIPPINCQLERPVFYNKRVEGRAFLTFLAVAVAVVALAAAISSYHGSMPAGFDSLNLPADLSAWSRP
jgi:hypothetical protein